MDKKIFANESHWQIGENLLLVKVSGYAAA